MTLYEESKDWCVEYAKTHGLKYKADLGEGCEKYFASKKEAQEFFDTDIPKPYTEAHLTYKSDMDFILVEVQYI